MRKGIYLVFFFNHLIKQAHEIESMLKSNSKIVASCFQIRREFDSFVDLLDDDFSCKIKGMRRNAVCINDFALICNSCHEQKFEEVVIEAEVMAKHRF